MKNASKSITSWFGMALVGAMGLCEAVAADARSNAPIDLEGFWISHVTEDWRWRMIVPPRGDHASVPLNAEGVRRANAWDPTEADSNTCLPYGAAGLMRIPMRVHIEWAGPDTLRLRTDRGDQTREFVFGPAEAPDEPSRQGHSVAAWDGSALKVTTSNLLPGYLRLNGVPYSGSARVTEYYNTHSAYGDDGFTVTTVVHDPLYLAQEFVTSTTFVKLPPEDAEWQPAPCTEPARDEAR